MTTNRIGLIGLGIMGKPMANNLLNAKHNLGLYARNPQSLSSFNNNKLLGATMELSMAPNLNIWS